MLDTSRTVLYFHTFNIDNTVLRHVNQSGVCPVVFTAMMLLMIAYLANTCELLPCTSPYWFILRPTVLLCMGRRTR